MDGALIIGARGDLNSHHYRQGHRLDEEKKTSSGKCRHFFPEEALTIVSLSIRCDGSQCKYPPRLYNRLMSGNKRFVISASGCQWVAWGKRVVCGTRNYARIAHSLE